MAAARAGPRTRSFARPATAPAPAPAPSLLQERVREMTAEATGMMQGYVHRTFGIGDSRDSSTLDMSPAAGLHSSALAGEC